LAGEVQRERLAEIEISLVRYWEEFLAVVDVIRQYVQVVAELGMTIERARLLAQKSPMLTPAAGADEFEGFLYVLQADRHWRLAVAIRVEEGRVSIVALRVTGFQL
jgi:hypothetical protein